MRKFDTKVQHLKYKVLREVARFAWEGTLEKKAIDIPEMIAPGEKSSTYCCVYKERAVLSKRVKLAMGGDSDNKNVIEVISIACDECPMSGYEVNHDCRGCLAHRCEDVCKFGAISFDEHQKCHIDKTKCKNCGACAKVCPFGAITDHKRPCQKACKINAIEMAGSGAAKIKDDCCIACGACVYQCPFGAIVDKSYIVDAIDIIKKSKNNKNYKVYAVVAPSISSQFTYAKLGQVISGIKELGCFTVIEAALGADMVAAAESKELIEKEFLTSSCCPAFVEYIKAYFPNLEEHISHNLSPMATIAKYIKETDKNSKIIFIGPCTAKKAEVQKEEVKPYVDAALTFEELQALFDSREIDITTLTEDVLDNASYFGRIFARSGGIKDAIAQALKEQSLDSSKYNPISCDGIEECKIALMKKAKGVLDANFIEGMACVGGCIGGAGCLTHGPKDKGEVDKYGMEAFEKTITDAIKVLKMGKR